MHEKEEVRVIMMQQQVQCYMFTPTNASGEDELGTPDIAKLRLAAHAPSPGWNTLNYCYHSYIINIVGCTYLHQAVQAAAGTLKLHPGFLWLP